MDHHIMRYEIYIIKKMCMYFYPIPPVSDSTMEVDNIHLIIISDFNYS